MLKKVLTAGALALAATLLIIQAVPYGRDHTNPPVQAEPAWDSVQTRDLATRACFDCHSNETTWPWYSNVAPASWLAQRDVDEGLSKLNFSEFNRPQEEAGEAAESVTDGEMPPWFYIALHPEARLSQSEKDALVRGLIATLGTEGDDEEGHALSR